VQYMSSSRREEINDFIEKAIIEAEEKGAKVVSLGLFNQVSTTQFSLFISLFIACLKIVSYVFLLNFPTRMHLQVAYMQICS